MPRKSIFKRNKKQIVKPVEEKKEEPERSSNDIYSLEINQDLYKDITNFGNQLADDGITINTDPNVYALDTKTVEPKKPALKKERKTRRKRKTKAEKEAEKKEEQQKKEQKKDDIMAKLKALEAARQIEINPEQVKKKLEPVKKPELKQQTKKDDIMSKLKALEASRQLNIKPIAKPQPKPQPKIIEEVKPKQESLKEALLMERRTYTFKIDTNDDTQTTVLYFYTAKDPTKKAIKMEYNNRSNYFCTFENSEGKWRRSTRLKLKEDKFTIRFVNQFGKLRYQVTGHSQVGHRLCLDNLAKIIRCDWTMKNIKLI